MDFDARVQQCLDGGVHRGTIAQDVRAEVQPLPHGHDGDTMPADVPAQKDRVARLHASGTHDEVVFYDAYARRVDEHSIAFAPVHHYHPAVVGQGRLGGFLWAGKLVPLGFGADAQTIK